MATVRSAKPDFHRRGVLNYGGGNLTAEQRSDLLLFLPAKFHQAPDRMRHTPADRVIQALDEALGHYDESGPARDAAAGIRDDLKALQGAAALFLSAIRSASTAARTVLDEEAQEFPSSLSTTGKLAVDWYGAMQALGLGTNAQEIFASQPHEGTWHEHSLLSRLWDLASDAQFMAGAALERRAPPERSNRLDRENGTRLVRFAVRHYAVAIGALPPRSEWYFSMMAKVGSYRGLRVQKATVRNVLDTLPAK